MSARLNFERDGTDWPHRDRSRFVSAAGLTWHVQIMGQGPVILLAHGTGASTHSFRALASILATDFTVVMPDLPGHGFTDSPRPTRLSLNGMAEDLASLMRALGLEPVLVVGHSAGAAILIEMCLERAISPDAIVSLNGALLPFSSLVGQFFSPLAKMLALNPFVPWLFTWRAGRPGAVEQLINSTGSEIDEGSIGFYRRLMESEAHVAAALGMMAKWDLSRMEQRLGGLDVPLILVAGGRDRAVPPDQAFAVRERAPKSDVVLLHGLGHLAHEERPEEIAEIVVKAARKREPALSP